MQHSSPLNQFRLGSVDQRIHFFFTTEVVRRHVASYSPNLKFDINPQQAVSRSKFGEKEEVKVHYPYLLPREGNSIPVASLRHHRHALPLRMGDPAALAMIDFQCVPPLTVTEDLALERALDEMFRLGVRAFLVVRERGVIGLLTVEHARGERSLEPLQNLRDDSHQELRVADVMTLSAEVPAVDWQIIIEAQIRDLVEIFDGSGAQHMVVLENEMPNLSSVRGLIHRGRLERQLGAQWVSSFGLRDEAAIA